DDAHSPPAHPQRPRAPRRAGEDLIRRGLAPRECWPAWRAFTGACPIPGVSMPLPINKEAPVAAFCRALWRGEKDIVTRLAPVVDPNGRDRWGHSPLSMAVQYGDLPLVSLLVGRGAEVDQE